MSEKEDIRTIKTKLQGFSAEAPSFDAIFLDEVPGEAKLRTACQSKLQHYTAEAPPFESLMAPNLPLPTAATSLPRQGKRHASYALWATGLAVAACLGLLVLLPVPVEQPKQNIGSVLEKNTIKHSKKRPIVIKQEETPFLAEALPTPVQLQQLEVPPTPIVQEETTSSNAVVDSSSQEQLDKLMPAQLTTLDAGSAIRVSDAYAKAKLAFKRPKREKMQAGLNVNGSNRLLSFVNTNKGSDPLLSTSNQYNKGLGVLDEPQGMSLRSSVASRNEWEAPENILPSSLSNYEATYSLPINIGFSLSIPINGLVELQTGCYYTYLYSRTEGMTGSSTFNLRRELHYLGIPVKLAFNIYQKKGLRTYLAVGGAIEKGLAGIQTSTVVAQNGEVDTWKNSQPVYGIQPSTNGLAGVSYEYPSGIALYLEPGASYCYNTNQPASIRTEEPFSFNLGLGLRYRLK